MAMPPAGQNLNSVLSGKIWRCSLESPVIMVIPLQIKTIDHHFNFVEHFISFTKSSRSSKLEFEAKSYVQNTKRGSADLGMLQGVAVHTRKGSATP
jgi:hypothetical protein